jgi:magnesium transporter
MVWSGTEDSRAGAVLLEVSPAVREALVETTTHARLLTVLRGMDADDLAYLGEAIPEAVRRELYASLDDQQLSWVRGAAAHAPGTVGHLMSSDILTVRDDATLGEALADLRARGSLPAALDAFFVVDARKILRGLLPLKTLLLKDPSARVADELLPEPVRFFPEDAAAAAAKAFERYDLLSAPVVDERGKVLGRLTVEAVVDFIRQEADLDALKRAGLSGEEDLFASTFASARNRWLWLAVNLVTALLASRVIGFFEDTIASLVALATLMPIVASVGGNTGNQTVALMIRRLALGQIAPGSLPHLFGKELSVSLLNGAVWGGAMGVVALVLYGNPALGLVMAAAVLLNLVVSAVVGISVPLLLHRLGRDPVQGSSVLLTFTTDSMGFFIFLALAKVFLV